MRRLLHVDDDAANLAALSFALSDKLSVDSVSSAKEALELLQRDKRFDVILADQRMPGMSGAQLFAQLNGVRAARVLYTAFADANAAVDAVTRGRVGALLVKPLDSDALCAALEHPTRLALARYETTRIRDELLESSGRFGLVAGKAEAAQTDAENHAGLALCELFWDDDHTHADAINADLRMFRTFGRARSRGYGSRQWRLDEMVELSLQAIAPFLSSDARVEVHVPAGSSVVHEAAPPLAYALLLLLRESFGRIRIEVLRDRVRVRVRPQASLQRKLDQLLCTSRVEIRSDQVDICYRPWDPPPHLGSRKYVIFGQRFARSCVDVAHVQSRDELRTISTLGPAVVVVPPEAVQSNGLVEHIAWRFPQVSIVAKRRNDFVYATRAVGRVRALIDLDDTHAVSDLIREVRNERVRLDQAEERAHDRFDRYYSWTRRAIGRDLSRSLTALIREAERIELGPEVRQATEGISAIAGRLQRKP